LTENIKHKNLERLRVNDIINPNFDQEDRL